MKNFSIWAYDHPVVTGCLVGFMAAINLFLIDLPIIAIGILLVATIVLLIGTRQNSHRYKTLHEEAKTILIPTITTPCPPKDDLPETSDIPPKLAVKKDDEEEAERINRLRYHHANDDPTGRWVGMGDDVIFLPYSDHKGSKPK